MPFSRWGTNRRRVLKVHFDADCKFLLDDDQGIEIHMLFKVPNKCTLSQCLKNLPEKSHFCSFFLILSIYNVK